MISVHFTKTTVKRFERDDAYLDPRAYLESSEQAVNDLDALMREEAELRAQREAAADDEWRGGSAGPDIDSPFDDREED
jgi:hypothetical protein